jgi:hypothetical protein
MEDGAKHRYGEVNLQVPEVVPGERPDNIALLYSHAFERPHQTKHPLGEIGVSIPEDPFMRPACDLFFGKELPAAIKQMAQKQRVLHHDLFLPRCMHNIILIV